MAILKELRHIGVFVSMPAKLLDGRSCAKNLEEELLPRIAKLVKEGVNPHLAVIIVGDDPASHVYVSAKEKACERLGIKSTRIDLPDDTDMSTLVKCVSRLNEDDLVNGILVQSPLPKHMDEFEIAELISPSKDVDGFHPSNLGYIVQGRLGGMIPCTPAGVMEMLRWANVELLGKKAVVIGRSFNVGMSQALLLSSKGADATVTVVHSRTHDVKSECINADIVIAAVGKAEMVKKDWIKNGAVVVDVGVNRIDDSSRERGWRLTGDVHPDVANVASLLSPVPGGVGPMTIALLMKNTVTAAEKQNFEDKL